MWRRIWRNRSTAAEHQEDARGLPEQLHQRGRRCSAQPLSTLCRGRARKASSLSRATDVDGPQEERQQQQRLEQRGQILFGQLAQAGDRVEALQIGRQLLEAEAEARGDQPQGHGRSRHAPGRPAASGRKWRQKSCQARWIRSCRPKLAGERQRQQRPRASGGTARTMPRRRRPAAPRSTRNCSAATNSLACGKLSLVARLFQAPLGRLLRFCRTGPPWRLISPEHLSRRGPGLPAELHSDAREQRRHPAEHERAPSASWPGKARDSSCSCALSRPSSASATSTITSRATTGRASRTPTRTGSTPSRMSASAGRRTRAHKCPAESCPGSGKQPEDLAVEPQGEEQQPGHQLREDQQDSRIGLGVGIDGGGVGVAGLQTRAPGPPGERFEHDGHRHADGDSHRRLRSRPGRHGQPATTAGVRPPASGEQRQGEAQRQRRAHRLGSALHSRAAARRPARRRRAPAPAGSRTAVPSESVRLAGIPARSPNSPVV